MSKFDYEVSPIPADVLLDVWEEIGNDKPAKELWPAAVEAGTNTVLAARHKRLGNRAVGSVDIMWNGPITVDETFRKVTEEIYPGEAVPAVYGLFVNDDFRQAGAATALMHGVEGQVLARDGAFPAIALTVRTDNNEAVPLYDKLEYRRQRTITQIAPVWNSEEMRWDPQEVQSFVMIKELL